MFIICFLELHSLSSSFLISVSPALLGSGRIDARGVQTRGRTADTCNVRQAMRMQGQESAEDILKQVKSPRSPAVGARPDMSLIGWSPVAAAEEPAAETSAVPAGFCSYMIQVLRPRPSPRPVFLIPMNPQHAHEAAGPKP